MPSNMERDLFSQAADFLSIHFQDRLTDADRLSLEHWMISQLEAERKGWKNSLQRSLQEVEKERKRGMDIDVKIEELNNKVTSYMSELRIMRQPSVYQNTDSDFRFLNMSKLEQNLDSIIKSIQALFDERVQCFNLLGSAPENGEPLDQLLTKALEKLKKKKEDACYKEQLLKQKSDIEYLLKSREESEKLSKEKDVKHLNEKAALTHIITRQREQLETMKQKEKVDKCTQYCLVTESKSVGVQVKMDLNSLKGSEAGSRFPSPIKSITITKKHEAGKRRRLIIHNLDHLGHAFDSGNTNEYQEEIKSIVSKSTASAKSTLSPSPKRTIETLKGQVIDFAERLEKAKIQVEIYQQQLTWMKSIPHSVLINQEVANIRKEPATTKYQDGYLSGMRKDLLPAVYNNKKSPDVLLLRSHIRGKLPRFAPVGAANNSSKCLRCYEMFKVRENHRKACRYHPRGKKKIEKYDNKGRIEGMVYLWECCLQRTEAIGCTSGEHV